MSDKSLLMKLRNLSVGTQLRISLGAILVLVGLLGAVAWRQAESLWEETQGLFEHPLTVRRAIGELTADVLTMHRAVKDLVLAENEAERLPMIQTVETCEADAQRQIAVLRDRFLGPRQDVEDINTVFMAWKSIREETLRLLREGQMTEALRRIKAGSIGGVQVDNILSEIRDVSNFATARGDQFYQEARNHKESLTRRLAMILAAILLLSTGVSYSLVQGIRGPLQELTVVTERFRNGDMKARSRYVSANEFGVLAASFNELAETIQIDTQRGQQAARIADVMLRETDLRRFCQELLQALLEPTGSQIGALYLLNGAGTDFELFESIGLSKGGRAKFSAREREGEFGAALATGRIQRITDIPADTRCLFSTVSGDFMPREIMTIPILAGAAPVGVISLASLRGYPAPAARLVNEILSVMTARLNGVLAFRQVQEFSGKLERQNQELEAQQKELIVQADELSEQNVELEMQKKQLDQASRLKSSFLSNMSHELRTPLNSVIALTGVLHRRLRGLIPAEEHGYLEVIERNGKQLLALINDVLDLSRIEAGREEISLSHFALHDLAAEVVAMLESQAREKNLALRNLVAGDLAPLHTDYVKCRHILQNLIGNAVKFTEAGQVTISARLEQQEMVIAVSDTGIGIAADHLPHIFDEFRQADESTSRKYGGTGLGLAIAKKYTAMLRGSLTVVSAPGQGSTFTLRLPVTLGTPVAADAAANGPSAARAGAPNGQGKTLLLVEDSEPAIIQLTDILKAQGYRLQVARNGKEALAQIGALPPDAMILDLMMPEVDGFQVLRAIRGREQTAALPVLIMTAKHITKEELNFLKGNHVHQLIQKGDISKAELLAAVERMVSPCPETRPPPRPRAIRTPPPGKPVILVVEDKPDNLKTVRALLEETCALIEATDGQAGVAQAREHRPDLILLDISLPVMDGFKTLDALRRDEALRPIPIVALTARAMKGDREAMLEYGFDGYVAKPIDEALLKDTLREILYGK